MRLHRFFVNFPIEHTKTTIKDEQLVHQWRDVFRYNVGSEIIIFDGSGIEYDSVIEKLNNREAEVRLVSERKGIVPDRKIVFDQNNSPLNPSLTLREGSPPSTVSIFIGPEGGWTENEIEKFKKAGAKIYSLGKLTLRAETAAIVALGVLKLLD